MSDNNRMVAPGPARPASEKDRLESTVLAERIREGVWQAQARQLFAQEWFDFASDGYLVTDLHGVVHEANYAAARMLGTRKEFLLGKPLGMFMAEESHGTFYEHLARLTMRSDMEQWEGRVSRPPGPPRNLMLRVISCADDEGIKLRWTLSDITPLREAQRQSLQAERLAAIGQMAAGMAHEGRNALQRIQACLAILTLRLQGRAEELELLACIQRAQDDLLHLFDDVRNYAIAPRLQQKRHDLRLSWREAWNDLSSRPEWTTAELREDVEGIEPACQADAFYLKHVFRNLFENALSCGANPVRIVVHCRPAMLGAVEAICLRIQDNGPGIPAEARSRLFEPFCTTKVRGTGLGLAICKRIIEAHGGRIEAAGTGASGAEIVITLPRRGA